MAVPELPCAQPDPLEEFFTDAAVEVQIPDVDVEVGIRCVVREGQVELLIPARIEARLAAGGQQVAGTAQAAHEIEFGRIVTGGLVDGTIRVPILGYMLRIVQIARLYIDMRRAHVGLEGAGQIVGNMIHMVHVGVHGGAAAHVRAGECLTGIGTVGIDQRLARPHRTLGRRRPVELHVEVPVHTRDAGVVVDAESVVEIEMRLQLQPFFSREDAVQRLSGEGAVDIGEQRAGIQRGIARGLLAGIAISGGADVGDFLAVDRR